MKDKEVINKSKGIIPVQIINFLHIYLYNVLITAVALWTINISADNALWVLVSIGLTSGVGIMVLDERKQILSQRLIGVKNAGWYALIAPFQVFNEMRQKRS